MARKPPLGLAVLVPRNIASAAIGRPVMQMLHDLLPAYTPHRFGHCEPLPEIMGTFDVERLARQWSGGFFWTSNRGVGEGRVWPENDYNGHARVRLSGKATPREYRPAVTFLLQLSELLRPDFAYVHLFTEREAAERAYEMLYPYSIGVTTHELRKYLPDLVWGTVFGPPYVRLFGRETLLSAPVHLARELGEETIYLQLTESLADLQTDYDRVDQVREATKDHLGRDAFLDMAYGQLQIYNAPPAGRYRTPDFRIDP
jgi:hypothetical protein